MLWEAVGWRRVLVTGACLVAWRALEEIPVSGLNQGMIALRLQAVNATSLLHAIGSTAVLAPYSIVALGIAPYIYALIVMLLLRVVSARIRATASTAEGAVRLGRWTRALAVVFALAQAYGWTSLMLSGSALQSPMGWFPRLVVIFELTAGTMILVLIADVLDELGLGFGNGAILVYALGPVAVQARRIADDLASAPSLDALYRPYAIWLIFSIAVVAATVAVVLGVRRLRPVDGKTQKPADPVDVKVLLSGVLRPPIFTGALLFVPVAYLNYLAIGNSGMSRWIFDYLTPYGPNPWSDIGYVIVDAVLVIGFTYFVVACDFRHMGITRAIAAHINRLTFIGGAYLALAVAVAPVVEWNASRAAGRGIPMSGFNTVLVAAVIAGIVVSLERARHRDTGVPVLASSLP